MASEQNTPRIFCSFCKHLRLAIIQILTRSEGEDEGDDGYGWVSINRRLVLGPSVSDIVVFPSAEWYLPSAFNRSIDLVLIDQKNEERFICTMPNMHFVVVVVTSLFVFLVVASIGKLNVVNSRTDVYLNLTSFGNNWSQFGGHHLERICRCLVHRHQSIKYVACENYQYLVVYT